MLTFFPELSSGMSTFFCELSIAVSELFGQPLIGQPSFLGNLLVVALLLICEALVGPLTLIDQDLVTVLTLVPDTDTCPPLREQRDGHRCYGNGQSAPGGQLRGPQRGSGGEVHGSTDPGNQNS